MAVQHGLPRACGGEAASLVVERLRNGEIRGGSQIAGALREAVVLLSGRPRRTESQQVYVAKKQAASVCREVLRETVEPKRRSMLYRLFAGGLTPEQVSGELEIEAGKLREWLRVSIAAFRRRDTCWIN